MHRVCKFKLGELGIKLLQASIVKDEEVRTVHPKQDSIVWFLSQRMSFLFFGFGGDGRETETKKRLTR